MSVTIIVFLALFVFVALLGLSDRAGAPAICPSCMNGAWAGAASAP